MTEQERDPVEEMAQLVGRVDARLPDTNRARRAVALVERIRREAGVQSVTKVPVRRGRAWPFLCASAGALVAAAVLLAWLGLRQPTPVVRAPSHDRGAPEAMPAGRATQPSATALPVQVGAADPAEEREILRILTPNGRLPEAGQARLQGKQGEEVRASLADCGRLILRGAGQVAVEENAASGIMLGLERGTLLVSFEHDSGRGLTVRTKDALVRVTGTVFAVRAGDGPTQVFVSRGSVEVESNGLPVSVSAGRSWRVGAKSLSALDMDIVQALRELRASEGGRSATSSMRGPSGFAQTKEVAEPTAVAFPVAIPPEAPAAETDAEVLYRAAEKALAAGHIDSAKAQLRGLLDKYPDHALAGPAMYELGRLAFAAQGFATAREQFSMLRKRTQPGAMRFHEPAAFFICRSDQALGRRAGAIDCFERYRAEFPGSPHGGDALAALATLHLEVNDCTAAWPLLDEYLHQYPGGSQARAMQAARDRCKRQTP
jgi:TolA-binding protein